MTVEPTISVISGQIIYPNLNNKLEEKEFAEAKAQLWLHMLLEGNSPQKWLKTTAKGTKVNFDCIRNQEDYDKGIMELKKYLAVINVEYGLNYQL